MSSVASKPFDSDDFLSKKMTLYLRNLWSADSEESVEDAIRRLKECVDVKELARVDFSFQKFWYTCDVLPVNDTTLALSFTSGRNLQLFRDLVARMMYILRFELTLTFHPSLGTYPYKKLMETKFMDLDSGNAKIYLLKRGIHLSTIRASYYHKLLAPRMSRQYVTPESSVKKDSSVPNAVEEIKSVKEQSTSSVSSSKLDDKGTTGELEKKEKKEPSTEEKKEPSTEARNNVASRAVGVEGAVPVSPETLPVQQKMAHHCDVMDIVLFWQHEKVCTEEGPLFAQSYHLCRCAANLAKKENAEVQTFVKARLAKNLGF